MIDWTDFCGITDSVVPDKPPYCFTTWVYITPILYAFALRSGGAAKDARQIYFHASRGAFKQPGMK